MVLLIYSLHSKLGTYNVTSSNWFRHNQGGFPIKATISNTTDNNAPLLVSMLHAKLTKASHRDVNTKPNVQEPTYYCWTRPGHKGHTYRYNLRYGTHMGIVWMPNCLDIRRTWTVALCISAIRNTLPRHLSFSYLRLEICWIHLIRWEKIYQKWKKKFKILWDLNPLLPPTSDQ